MEKSDFVIEKKRHVHAHYGERESEEKTASKKRQGSTVLDGSGR
jgi:hypothetical protein